MELQVSPLMLLYIKEVCIHLRQIPGSDCILYKELLFHSPAEALYGVLKGYNTLIEKLPLLWCADLITHFWDAIFPNNHDHKTLGTGSLDIRAVSDSTSSWHVLYFKRYWKLNQILELWIWLLSQPWMNPGDYEAICSLCPVKGYTAIIWTAEACLSLWCLQISADSKPPCIQTLKPSVIMSGCQKLKQSIQAGAQ